MTMILTTAGKTKLTASTASSPVVIERVMMSTGISTSTPNIADTAISQHCFPVYGISAYVGGANKLTAKISFVVQDNFLINKAIHRYYVFDKDNVLIFSGTYDATAITDTGFGDAVVVSDTAVVTGGVLSWFGYSDVHTDITDLLAQLNPSDGVEYIQASMFGAIKSDMSVDPLSAFKTITGPVIVNQAGVMEPRDKLTTVVIIVGTSELFDRAKFSNPDYIHTRYNAVAGDSSDSVWAKNTSGAWVVVSSVSTALYRTGQFYCKETYSRPNQSVPIDVRVEFGYGNSGRFFTLIPGNKYDIVTG